MRIVIAGGHGQIARRLGQLLTDRNDTVIGLIRNPAHAQELQKIGVQSIVCDLETASPEEISKPLANADAVVFAAGAGPGSGAARKDTVDRAAAQLLADAAVRSGVRRYLMVSTRGAGSKPRAGLDEVAVAYFQAKTAADEYLMRQDLDWTVLRPAALTNDPGTGTVHLAANTGPGQISREDTAAVLLALLDTPATAGLVLELTTGLTPIAEAVSACADNRTGETNR